MDPALEREVYKTLTADFYKNPGLTHFMKARYEGDEVSLLLGQESYKMNAFVDTNCLVQLDEEKSEFRKGEQLRVYPLNQLWV